jgi:hypothetical protein
LRDALELHCWPETMGRGTLRFHGIESNRARGRRYEPHSRQHSFSPNCVALA